MKKILAVVLALTCLLGLAGCTKEEDVLHLGLNAEITEINADEYTLSVKDSADGSQSIFGEKTIIDCSKAVNEDNILYAKYDNEGDVRTIGFNDLMVGDKVILSIYDSELNDSQDECMVAEAVQLATQRLD